MLLFTLYLRTTFLQINDDFHYLKSFNSNLDYFLPFLKLLLVFTFDLVYKINFKFSAVKDYKSVFRGVW